ncbi:MAG TPA: low affinity iron permease family protein [Candidatus Peribacteraceae bacterium]|nr:low affinity iron permease family protein [Candidatus Peribacteraceae bacterium]
MALLEDIVSPSSRHPFGKFAKWTATASGHPLTFLLAVLIVVVWLVTGPLFGYSDTWQLVINTGTTIITFLMVFLIQNTQNRDSVAMQIKLDELIRSSKEAHNALLEIEELTERELNQLKKKYAQLAADAREELRQGRKDKGSPDV